MAVLYTNNATSALSASITNVATSMSVTAGQGALFPAISGSDYFYVTLVNNSGTYEIVKVTARSTDTFTIARGQDGTTGTAFTAGDKVELRVTKGMLDDFKTDAGAPYLPLAGGTLTGGLTFSGSTLRLRGDFSNATIANRMAFQTSTANTATSLGVLPNGTSSQSGVNFFNNSDPTNAGSLNLLVNSTEASIRAGITGSGSYLPITAYTSGALRFTVGTSGQWGIGTTPDYGTTGYFFRSGGASAAPTWSALTSSDITTALGGTPPKVTMSETAPSTPTAGDLWWNSGTGVMYIYFTDIDSTSQWVDISSSNAVSSSGGGVSTGKAIAMSMVFGF